MYGNRYIVSAPTVSSFKIRLSQFELSILILKQFSYFLVLFGLYAARIIYCVLSHFLLFFFLFVLFGMVHRPLCIVVYLRQHKWPSATGVARIFAAGCTLLLPQMVTTF